MTEEQKSTTEKIVGLLFRRDEEGLRLVQLHFGSGMKALARNITGSSETAEEIVNWQKNNPIIMESIKSRVRFNLTNIVYCKE